MKTLRKPWPEPLKRFLQLAALPACVHAFGVVFFGLEADGSGLMLFGAMFCSAAVGSFFHGMKYDPVTAAAAASWFPALASWRRWYWAVGLSSPGGSAQALVRWLGWSDVSAPEAVAAITAACGLAGWTLMRVDRWYTGRTGHSMFENLGDS